MIKHVHTEPAITNFSKLESRLMNINHPSLSKSNEMRELLYKIVISDKPTLVVATGGSKVVAYYMQSILENSNIICEVIEPRDYFYKKNNKNFFNLIAISTSGNTNGIEEALKDFEGNGYLVCEEKRESDYQVISWGNELYDKEKSFISLASSLGPISLLLSSTSSLNSKIESQYIKEVNNKIKMLLDLSIKKVENISTNFSTNDLIQIMSGYDTRCSSSALESNLIEVGLCSAVIHDKGSYCHGRSNLSFKYPDSPMIYLSHQEKELDILLIDSLKTEYSNLLLFDTKDINDTYFWKEYYLLLQMYFLSKKIADDKNIDITQPEYNPNIVRKVYKYKGEL